MISVVMPVYNEVKYISVCVESLLSQDYPKGDVEILAVDGMSTDSTVEVLKKYSADKRVKILKNPGRVVPKALNIGIKNARGEIIIRADAHAKYPVNYISKCVELLNRVDADNVGGIIIHSGEGIMGEAIALAQESIFGLGGAKFRTANKEQYVDTLFPGCWKKTAFDFFGLFNEKLERNQDIEHNARIRKMGGKIFLDPEIKSYYYCRPNLWGLWKQYFKNGYWNIITSKITPGSLSLRHFVPIVFVLSLLISWVIPPVWLFIAAAYLACNLLFSVKSAFANGLKYVFLLPAVFLVLHLSYGFGLLSGIFLQRIK